MISIIMAVLILIKSVSICYPMLESRCKQNFNSGVEDCSEYGEHRNPHTQGQLHVVVMSCDITSCHMTCSAAVQQLTGVQGGLSDSSQ